MSLSSKSYLHGVYLGDKSYTSGFHSTADRKCQNIQASLFRLGKSIGMYTTAHMTT